MIPPQDQAEALWEKYHLPREKRIHVTLVARVSGFLARAYEKKYPQCSIDHALLLASALLHDIDKNVPKLPGEKHPDACVRILKEEGMEEVARVVAAHPLHAILDPALTPATIEERLLFLADKMVKYEILTVDRRFDLWRSEPIAEEARELLNRCYPKVKALEKEIFEAIDIAPSDISSLAQRE